MRHVALMEIIAIGKYMQPRSCCLRLVLPHRRIHFAYVEHAVTLSSTNYVLIYELRVDSIGVTRVTELVWSVAQKFDKY